MQYKIGDLLYIKDCQYARHNCISRPIGFMNQLYAPTRLCWEYDIFRFFGIITKTIKHKDAWHGNTTHHDDVYFLYSQLDGKESYFFADEVTVEDTVPNNTMLSI